MNFGMATCAPVSPPVVAVLVSSRLGVELRERDDDHAQDRDDGDRPRHPPPAAPSRGRGGRIGRRPWLGAGRIVDAHHGGAGGDQQGVPLDAVSDPPASLGHFVSNDTGSRRRRWRRAAEPGRHREAAGGGAGGST